jgi:3-deoxy-manno-octulosonate cytidylyltransferase (CMP-KDO synthetase)
MKVTGIIPSRYASTRFPGKPLALIGGKPMIQWVYEKASEALTSVYVATDDDRIANVVMKFGGRCVMTSPLHRSGTDRCAEASEIIESQSGESSDIIINIQGDEPFIRPEQIISLAGCFEDVRTDIATLIKPVEDEDEIFDPNKPKVVFSKDKVALYFSRSPIPYLQGKPRGEWHTSARFYRHIGIYAYRTGILRELSALKPAALEESESLEQLRWLANGYRIRVEETHYGPFGIDTPEDLEKAIRMLNL